MKAAILCAFWPSFEDKFSQSFPEYWLLSLESRNVERKAKECWRCEPSSPLRNQHPTLHPCETKSVASRRSFNCLSTLSNSTLALSRRWHRLRDEPCAPMKPLEVFNLVWFTRILHRSDVSCSQTSDSYKLFSQAVVIYSRSKEISQTCVQW